MTLRGCFVTGTDTEVGKTRVSAGLIHALAAQGLRVGGLKPVAAGLLVIDGQPVHEDVQVLQAASAAAGMLLRADEICALALREACAPHRAAALDGIIPDRAALVAQVRGLAPRADGWVVEGVGGFCVPLSAPGAPERWGMADVAADLALPVVLVVGLRLGCLNHALLTAQAIRARGLVLAGWIGNTVDPRMAEAAANIDALREWLDAPCLGVVPRLSTPDAAAVAAHLDGDAVRRVLAL